MNIRRDIVFWRSISGMFFLSLGAAVLEIMDHLKELEVLFSFYSPWWIVVIFSSVIVVLGLVLLWTRRFKLLVSKFIIFFQKHHLSNQIVSWGLFLGITISFSAWVIWGGYIVLNGYFVRITFYYTISLVGMFLIQPVISRNDWRMALLASLLIAAGLYRVVGFLPQLSTSPFSLGWSEGSRYYYGSLYSSQELYNQNLPLSAWHPTRYLLLAIPFLVSGAPIWIHRLWQIFLWVGLTGGSSLALAKRLNLQGSLQTLMYIIWAFLFLLQGPVYYHLSICLIIIWLGVDFNKPKQTFWVVMIASIWAGLSRVNWIPVPLFLTITLYFLEIPMQTVKKKWHYFIPPIRWSLGMVVALMASTVYIYLAGNDSSKFGSSFTSALLWNRLWPNTTFPLGIVIGAMLLTLPLLVVSYFRIMALTDWVSMKKLGLVAMLLVFFVGGLVVSVKIGGGSNLHNMDAYSVLLMTLGSYLIIRKKALHEAYPILTMESKTLTVLGIIIIMVPIFVTLNVNDRIIHRDEISEAENLLFLQQLSLEIENQNEKMLFIAERQLQVFGYISTTSFVPNYEKIELMEMAMADNHTYLAKFYEDIANQNFAVIVSDPISLVKKGDDKAFSEEHNIWVEQIGAPLLEYYQPHEYSIHERFWILIPKP